MLLLMQPAFRCEFGAPLFARWGNSTDGGPQNFPNEINATSSSTPTPVHPTHNDIFDQCRYDRILHTYSDVLSDELKKTPMGGTKCNIVLKNIKF